jgi:hypothetical protein
VPLQFKAGSHGAPIPSGRGHDPAPLPFCPKREAHYNRNPDGTIVRARTAFLANGRLTGFFP